ncbi:MAG: glycoside hydrolase family 26 protein [Oscillospiraceae bacterium]|nr:glycoside hydrolase family 26 protein [Oscillospiraceae bacterium]
MKRFASLLLALLLLAGCSAVSEPPETPPSPSGAEETPPGRPWDPPSPSPPPSPKPPVVKEQYVMDDSFPRLRNPNATEEAQMLYNYLCGVYKSKTLTGQQESTWMGTPEYEMDYIFDVTGEYPAIRGLDFINNDFDGVVRRSKEWRERGGIVSICWHWGTPPDGVGYESSKGTIDLEEALTEGSELYEGMLRQMDRAAGALLELQEAGVPVLWRPFHEFDGAWFWWGKGGKERFIELWQLMYTYYTDVWGLNNLIWVLGFADGTKAGWYPGDDYVDIAAGDSYQGGTQSKMYGRLVKIFGEERPVAFHECGVIPDLEKAFAEGGYWSWFLTWHTNYIKDNNTKEHLQYIYTNDRAVTLDKLPKFQ